MMTEEKVAELQAKTDALWSELCRRDAEIQPLRSQWCAAEAELRDARSELKVRAEIKAWEAAK